MICHAGLDPYRMLRYPASRSALDSGFPYRMLPSRMLRYRSRRNDGVSDNTETVNMSKGKIGTEVLSVKKLLKDSLQ